MRGKLKITAILQLRSIQFLNWMASELSSGSSAPEYFIHALVYRYVKFGERINSRNNACKVFSFHWISSVVSYGKKKNTV